MKNPLSNNYSEKENLALVNEVLEGDAKALDKLVKIHQPFIYNVAWKMTHSNEDALDLTQEVLIKVITKLSTFKKKSAFRTWLYRIVFNEFLQTKKKAKSALKMGVLNEHNLILKPAYTKKIGDFVAQNQAAMTEILDGKYIEIFRNHPAKSTFDAQTVISKIINDKMIKNLFNI